MTVYKNGHKDNYSILINLLEKKIEDKELECIGFKTGQFRICNISLKIALGKKQCREIREHILP